LAHDLLVLAVGLLADAPRLGDLQRLRVDLAVSVAPGAPWAWDQRIVADAAFARYVREATDYAGGRRMPRY